MTRVLVTGASGFIGRAATAALARDGYTVYGAGRRPPSDSLLDGLELRQHPDLAQPFDWLPLLEGVDKIIHLAGIAHSGGTAAALYDNVNRQATAQLAVAAARAGVTHFVFVSSIRAQSGPAADHALTENDPARPTDVYGRSKLAAEDAVRAAGVPFTILRPVLVYGPGVKGNLATLVRAANSRWPLPVSSFGNRRSLLGIDNLISALQFVLATPTTIGETYIVADPGIPPRLSEVFTTLRQACGRRSFAVPVPPHYVEMPLRLLGRGDLWERLGGNLRVDVTKLIAAGWKPVHDTRAGLAAFAKATASQAARRSANA